MDFAGKFLRDEKPNLLHRYVYAPKAVIETQVKFPDVSFYQGTINWGTLSSVSPAAIIRAGQNVWEDPKFAYNYAKAKENGVLRGVYWFYDSRISPTTQANILINQIKNDLPEMEVFCDWEYNYGGSYFDLSYAVMFMKAIEQALPSVKVGMYTGYYFFKDNTNAVTHSAEYAYLKTKPLWLAWYTTVPAYVQIPSPWTHLTHWQYTSSGNGAYYGVESSAIDLNWFNGTVEEFNQMYKDTDVPDTTKSYTYTISRDKIVKAFVTGYSSFKTVQQAADDFQKVVTPGNKSLVFNGDGWIGTQSNSIWVSNGVWKNAVQMEYRPRIAFDKSNIGSINFADGGGYPEKKADYNTFSLTRRLVTGGKINPSFVDNGEKNSRIGFGFTSNGDLVICAKDGWDYYKPDNGYTPPAGWTLTELANELIKNGVIEGGDGDAGGSLTIAEDGQVINYYNDDGEIIMRPVVNHFCIEITDGSVTPPPIGDVMYKCTVLLDTAERVAPNISADKTGLVLKPGATWETDYYNQISELEAWVGTESGNYTAQRYPRPDSTIPKVYVKVEEVVVPPVDGTPFTLTVTGYKPFYGMLENE